MLSVSLILNVAVLTPLLFALWQDTTGMSEAYGPDSPARRILTCVYFAIWASSLVLLALRWLTEVSFVQAALTLFALQVVYKVATGVVLGLGHPVAIANLAISAVHLVTIYTLIR